MKDWIKLDPIEVSRTYIYESGSQLTFMNINRIKVSSSGTHYLETLDGRKYVIAPIWAAIELVTPEWTF